jgi:hypothetical protein
VSARYVECGGNRLHRHWTPGDQEDALY